MQQWHVMPEFCLWASFCEGLYHFCTLTDVLTLYRSCERLLLTACEVVRRLVSGGKRWRSSLTHLHRIQLLI